MGVKKINGGAEDFINKFVRSRGGDSTELEAAPVIQSTSLSINNTTGARFTGKSFDLTSTLSEDGRPGSTKMVEASVRGSLGIVYETDSITSVATTAAVNQLVTLSGQTGQNLAGDGVNSWMMISSALAKYQTATGSNPQFGSFSNMTITNGGAVDYLYAVAGSKAGTWIATGSQNGNPDYPLILRSTDFGSNWARTVLSNSVSTNHIKMRYVATDNNGNWVCLGETSEQYGYTVTSYSTDDGVTWSAIAKIATTNDTEPMGLATHDGSWVAMTYRTNGNISGMYRSTDVGATWTYSALPEPYPYDKFAGISVSDEGTWIMGFRSTSNPASTWVFISTNGGAGWGTVDIGENASQIVYVGGRTWYIRGYTGNYLSWAVSNDDGLTWRSETQPLANPTPESTGTRVYGRAAGCVAIVNNTNLWSNVNNYITYCPTSYVLDLSSSDGLSDIVPGMAVNNGGSTTGTVLSVDSGASEIIVYGDVFTSTGSWSNGNTVVTDSIITSNSELYLVFNSSGTITDLSTTPQDPYYSTLDNPVDLTFTFPSTFPSGAAPDTELPAGTSLCAVVTSFNKVGVSQLAAKVTP